MREKNENGENNRKRGKISKGACGHLHKKERK